MRTAFVRVLSVAVAAVLPFVSSGGTNDVDRTDPNFVTASLLIIGPGNELFGCAGHASVRLECPKFNLDYCFSCESESIKGNFGKFVLGNMKMGMFAIPTKEFLALYKEGGRMATQYPLNLPADAKQRFWKLMDDKVAQGACLHYDYIKYCCVQSVLQPLLEAIRPHEIKFPPWPEKYKLSRREILADNLAWCPWTRIFLHTIAGTEVDRQVSNVRTVILSPDLVELLSETEVEGKKLIAKEGKVVQPYQAPTECVFFTPLKAAWLVLLLAVANVFLRWRWVDRAFLAFQTLLGFLLTYLLAVSHLPATDWNWLVIPFNPLPLVLWRWRRYWAWGFVAVLLAWEAFMLLSPHQLTDPAYLVIVLAYIILYARHGFKRII